MELKTNKKNPTKIKTNKETHRKRVECWLPGARKWRKSGDIGQIV